MHAFTVHLAFALKETLIKVNAAHPGNVVTDLNPAGLISAAEETRTAVCQVMLPGNGPHEKFFHLDLHLPS